MAYTGKTTWVDDDGSGTTGTPVTAARMNNLEDGVAEGRVGAPGDFAVAGALTVGGQPVTPGGASEVHVGPEAPTDSEVLWIDTDEIAPGYGVPRVTALPATPADGDEVYYVADAANGILWHLRYNANSASQYKWEFIGGSEKWSSVGASAATIGGGSSWSATLTDGTGVVSMTIPLAGEYVFSFNGIAYTADGSVRNVGVGVGKDGAPSYAGNAFSTVPGGAWGNGSGMQKSPVAVTAGAVWMCYLYAAVVVTYANRWFSARPVRVG